MRVRQGDFFTTTGEILLPEVQITEGAGGRIVVRARIQHTFPLNMAEVVWGNGSETHRKIIPLTETRPFGGLHFFHGSRERRLEVGSFRRLGCCGGWRLCEPHLEIQMMRTLLAACLSAAVCGAAVVAVDGYHNNETKDPDHYRWEGTRNGGYSQLGAVIQGLKGELRTVREPLTAAALRGIDVFLIADPDTPAEASRPEIHFRQ